jgi:hypothetical protein
MEKDKGEDKDADTSQFFLVRLWPGNSGEEGRLGSDEEDRVQGKVQHVLSGEAASFNNWPALTELLKDMMHYGAQQEARSRTYKSTRARGK